MYIPEIKNKDRLKKQDRSSPRYKAWKKYVLERDNGTCQEIGCGQVDRIQVHHIKKFASKKHLRYDTCNGICLCKAHHDAIAGKEDYFVQHYYKIVEKNEQEYKKRQAENDSGHEGKTAS